MTYFNNWPIHLTFSTNFTIQQMTYTFDLCTDYTIQQMTYTFDLWTDYTIQQMTYTFDLLNRFSYTTNDLYIWPFEPIFLYNKWPIHLTVWTDFTIQIYCNDFLHDGCSVWKKRFSLFQSTLLTFMCLLYLSFCFY